MVYQSSKRMVIFGEDKGEEVGLQEVECPGADDGLCAALHAEFAIEVIDVLLHRVHADDQVTGDRTIRGSLKQQPQHLALALSERLHERTGACCVKGRIRSRLFVKGSQERRNITGYYATCLGQAQQG